MSKSWYGLIFILLIGLAASGCRPAPIVAASILETQVPQPVESPADAPSPVESLAPAPAPTPIPDIHVAVAVLPEPIELPVSAVSKLFPILSDPDAIPLDIPQAAQVSDSGWRPPLYPVPWAVGSADHFYFLRPILADEKGWLLDDYKYGYIYEGFENIHTGVDIDAATGTPVYAAAAGKIIWASYGLLNGRPDPDDPYGLAVAIRHDFGFKDQRLYTIYAHLSQVNIQLGDLVEAGQQIGLVGTTGATTGPHLHFEVRLGENGYFSTRNPELWMAPPQGWGVLVGTIRDTAGRLIKSKQVYLTRYDSEDHWTGITYGPRSVHPDEYYAENLVFSDLPAGKYRVTLDYLYQKFTLDVEILPGQITYFGFMGRKGYSTTAPSTLELILPVTTP